MLQLLAVVFAGAIEPPVLDQFVAAEHPATTLADTSTSAATEVVVGIQIVVSADGLVEDAVVVEPSTPAFDAAALGAVRQFHFQPARLDGEPIPVRILYRYVFTLTREAAPTPVLSLTGVVLERWDKTPLPGILVERIDARTSTETRSSTVTGLDGRFAFVGVSTGAHTLRLSGPGVLAVTTEQTVAENTNVDLQLLVERQIDEAAEDLGIDIDDEEVVRAPKVKKRAVETRVEAAQAKIIPGTQGDTVKVVQSLPGVARATAGSGDLIVWGASPGDTRAYVDEIYVPRVFHTGGVRSTIGADLVEALELVPGGFGPAWGRALGGLVHVKTRALSQQSGLHGHVAADLLDVSAAVQARTSERTWLAAGGRVGWLEQTFGRAVDASSRELVPIPRYWDYQVKGEFKPAPDDSLALLVFGSGDDVRRGVSSDDPSIVRSERTALSYHRVGLDWRRDRADGSAVRVVPWFGTEHNERQLRVGAVPAGQTQDILRGGVRASERRVLTDQITVEGGLDVEATRAHLERGGSLSEPAREGDVRVFGAAPGDRINSDRWAVSTAAAAVWATLEVTLGSLSIGPGVRAELVLVDGDKGTPPVGDEAPIGYSDIDVSVDPRLTARWSAATWLAFEAAAGLYSQAPDPADLSAVFGNPRLSVAHGRHALAATKLDLEMFRIELTGFFTQTRDLATRSADPTPPVGAALQAQGRGRTIGAQALLRFDIGEDIFGWVSYTLSRAERRDHEDAPWRLFDGDQSHVVSAVASWSLGHGFEVGTRFRFASGVPRTEVIGAYFNSRDGVFEPIFGEQNDGRLPDFMQLDLRASWRWKDDPFAFSVYLDVQNVTNRSNPEEVVYVHDFEDNAFVTGLPLLPVLGVRGEF